MPSRDPRTIGASASNQATSDTSRNNGTIRIMRAATSRVMLQGSSNRPAGEGLTSYFSGASRRS